MGLFKPNIKKMIRKKDVEGLIDVLRNHKDLGVREEAAHALGDLGDVKSLIQMMEMPELLLNLASQLVEIGESALEPLINALNDGNYFVRGGAATALGLMHNKRAVKPLIDALKHESSGLRIPAAIALGEIGDKSAVAALEQAARDKNFDVRKVAEQALQKIQ